MARASIRLDSSLKATITAGKHTWIADEPLADGGTDMGPTPMQMLVGALGACAAITAQLYARRKGWPLEGVEINVDLERFKKEAYPVYTGSSDVVNEIRQCLVFLGPLSDEQKRRLLEIAGKCPVHRVLTQPNFLIEEMLCEEELEAGV
jgi:putative redox protein